MEKELLQDIENEVLDFIRRIVITDKQEGHLDRSAFMILRQLTILGPVGVTTLAEQLNLDSSTISRQAAALADKGYVDKKPKLDDKRAFFYSITTTGADILSENKQRRLDGLEIALRDWSVEECATFATLLKKYNESINMEKKM
ncbi:MarR family transcriptional regulator [Sporosarcina sp. BI001-red]|uniref:MarR family winged helix-turn-helix transcriptional regulator n=1 Tax=Sporosarcina sp. BI001-red TaxID=2282866 RepID=UPI000E22F5EA|nr:MarR family transcriptional regulator [Sporosarcina sp. BI001-red]REB11013.1 MarR family transcriptional regulator [Sporosarcina sp. BI001-red]